MIDGWRSITLGEFVTLQRGHDLPEQERRPGRVPILGSFGVTGFHDEVKARGPGVTVGRSGASFGVACYSAEDFWPLNTALYVIDFHGNDPRFAYYFLKAFDFQRYNSGSAQPSLNRNFIHPVSITVPPPAEQQFISTLLGALDDKIELNQRMNETLEAMARALFKSWFIDFDPVRAKMAGRATAGMDAATAVLFPNGLDEVGIPRGWRRAGLGSWAEALSGGTPSKSDPSLWNGMVPWISPKVMTDLHADQAEAHVAESAIGNGTRLAPAGSTLVMVRGMGLHEKVRVSQARREVTFNQDVKALVPRGIEPSLLLFALLHGQEELLGKVESSGHGTGKLPTEILLRYEIAMPPGAVQAQLTKFFDDIGDRIAAAREESRTLAVLRDTLLPKLLSGELRVRDAKRKVEKVA